MGVVLLSASGLDAAQLSARERDSEGGRERERDEGKKSLSMMTSRDEAVLWVREGTPAMGYQGCPPSPHSAPRRAPSTGPARSSCLCCSSGTRSSWNTRHAAKLPGARLSLGFITTCAAHSRTKAAWPGQELQEGSVAWRTQVITSVVFLKSIQRFDHFEKN